MTEPYKIIRRFLFELVGMTSLDRNVREVINLLFVLPILFHLIMYLGLRKYYNFGTKNSRRAWQEVKVTRRC